MKIFSVNYSANNFALSGANSAGGSHSAAYSGLRMDKNLNCDTVSFGMKPGRKTLQSQKMRLRNAAEAAMECAQTNKKAGKESDRLEFKLANDVAQSVELLHKKLRHKFCTNFSTVLTTEEHVNYLTMKDRVKTPDSISQKAACRQWQNKKEIMENMGDISGFCFILEEPKSFLYFSQIFNKMVKSGDITVKSIEYMPARGKKNSAKYAEYYKSFGRQIENFAEDIQASQETKEKILDTVKSNSGYSGLHINIVSADGMNSEIQVMTRAMHNFKDVENIGYKLCNGKKLKKEYKKIENHMNLFNKDNTNISATNKKYVEPAKKAYNIYTKEMYRRICEKPYDNSFPKYKPVDFKNVIADEMSEKYSMDEIKHAIEMINKYDYDTIRKMKTACDTKRVK